MLRFACLLFAGLVLAACTTAGSNIPVPTPRPTNVVSAAIERAQARTERVCGFLPAAETVVALLEGVTGRLDRINTAGDVANSICHAVAPPATTRRELIARQWARSNGFYGSVESVPVEGEFVK